MPPSVAKCPISKKDAVADKKLVITKSEAVYFCCNDCAAKYDKENFAKK